MFSHLPCLREYFHHKIHVEHCPWKGEPCCAVTLQTNAGKMFCNCPRSSYTWITGPSGTQIPFIFQLHYAIIITIISHCPKLSIQYYWKLLSCFSAWLFRDKRYFHRHFFLEQHFSTLLQVVQAYIVPSDTGLEWTGFFRTSLQWLAWPVYKQPKALIQNIRSFVIQPVPWLQLWYMIIRYVTEIC